MYYTLELCFKIYCTFHISRMKMKDTSGILFYAVKVYFEM